MSAHRLTRCSAGWAAIALLVLAPSPASAQDLGVDPGEVRPTLPAPQAPGETDLTLPPLEQGPVDRPGELAVPIERVVVTGSTVFSDAEIARALEPFVGRPMTSADLTAARDALTHLYVDHGYVTSGAVVPDQQITAGTLTLHVIEGAVSEIEIEGNDRIRDAYLAPRLRAATRAPVQLGRVRETLRRLQNNRYIERIDAHLEPGARRGESRLVVTVHEAAQWALALEVANDRSPTVGSTGIAGDGTIANVIGVNDVWRLRVQATRGVLDIDARFEVPITRFDTIFRFELRDTHIEVVEDPFDVLDIEAEGRRYGLSIFHPLLRRGDHSLWLQLTGEYEQQSSTVLGLPFCFELFLEDCDEPTIAALRGGLQYTWTTQRNVVSARALFSGGLPILGATTGVPKDRPDGQFFVWLGQTQWAHVLPDAALRSTLLLRGDLQLANDALLGLEKIAIGGRRTVRGHRENQLVRDNGAVLSGEVRVPVWRTSLDRPVLELVPFIDWGYAWNNGIDPPQNQLWSIGAGFRFMPWKGTLGEFYWGSHIDTKRDRKTDLQDYGISFRVRIDAPEVF